MPSLLSSASYAAPEGGVVAHGAAGIVQSGSVTTITQSTDRAVIDWQKFNLTVQESAKFIQPAASSVTVNRISDVNPSTIQGSLTANGNVVLINPNGILFGPTAKVDVQGLVASTARPTNADAKAWAEGARKDLPLSIAGNKDGAIYNAGTITAREAGLVGFIAPTVINDGVIRATKGKVHLASGDTATLDLQGDGLVNIAVSDDTTNQLVHQHGLVEADGGTVILSAAAGQHVANGIINMDGVIQARSLQNKNGHIILSAEGSNAVAGNVKANKGKKAGNSLVVVSGVLDASGRAAGQKGGHITVTGDHVALTGSALLDASGEAGKSGTTTGQIKSASRRDANDNGSAGGEILIGGDYLGQGGTPNALNVYIDSGALILNDAIGSGDAGRTIVWSDHDTGFYGTVLSRALGGLGTDPITSSAIAGGALGDGGFVETSGHNHLDAIGYVDLTASNALSARGTYFLDPTNITIYGNVDPKFTSTDGSINLASSLKLWLDASDTSKVILTYSTDALSSATASGVSGATTITTSANVASSLAVGARIRLGAAGSAAAASTLGADTYTIAAISGTTITLTSALTSNYTASALYRGLVSQLADKNTVGSNALQAAQSQMPLWVSNGGSNGAGTVRFDGGDYLRSTTGYPVNSDYSIMTTVNQTANFTGNVISTNSSHAFYFNNSQKICMFSGGCFATSNTNLAYGTTGEFIATFINSTKSGQIYQNGTSVATGTASASNTDIAINIGSYGNGNFLKGDVNEVALYNTVLSANGRTLLDQYQSAKYNLALLAPGSGSTEAAKAMASTARGDATDGYSVFTTRYLERLSQTADISLQAGNNISLDFKGDTLNLSTAGRAITLTAGNQINTLSAGGITTNGGAINFNATNGILLNHVFALNSNGGAINLNNAVTSATDQTFNAGTGTITANAIAMGARNLTLTANDLALTGNLSGTGILTLQPYSTSRNVRVAYGNGDFNLDGSELARFSNGWSQINIGRSDGVPDTYIGAAAFTDPVTFLSNSRNSVYGTVSGTDNASITFQNGWVDLYGNVGTMGRAINFNTSSSTYGTVLYGGNVSSAGGNVSFNKILAYQGGISVNSAGGNITFNDAISNYAGATGRNIVLDAGAGTLTLRAVDSGQNLTFSAGNMVFNGDWGVNAVLGNVMLTSSQSMVLPYISALSLFARTTGATADITLAAGKSLVTSGTGNALTLVAARNFINNAGTLALSMANGSRWLIYSSNPTDTLGEQLLANSFNRYSCTYSSIGACAGGAVSIPGTGNGLLYSYTPILTVTPNNTSVTYGNAGPSLTAYGYTLSGYNSGDVNDIITGSLNGSTNYVQGADVGSYGLAYGNGSLASFTGYGFNYATNNAGILVAPRVLTASLTGSVSKTYDGLNHAILTVGNYLLSNVYGSDNISLSGYANGTYDDQHAGTGKLVSVSGLGLTGAKAGNYTISSASISANMGTVLAKMLTPGLTGAVSKTYDGAADAPLAAGNFTLAGGIIGSDVVVLNHSLAGLYDNQHAGSGKNVSVGGLFLSGANASDYQLAFTTVSSSLGNILAKTLVASLVGDVNKTYDGTTTATLSAANYNLTGGIVGGDVVGLNAPLSGSYDNQHTGNGKTVTANGLALDGANASDYQLAFTSVSSSLGNILAKTLVASLTGSVSKTYDGTADATLAANNYHLAGGIISGDTVDLNSPTSGSYDDQHAGAGKNVSVSGLQLTGANATDYQLATTSLNNAIGVILTKGLDIAATIGQHKTYGDAEPSSLAYTYSGLVNGDSSASFTGALSRVAGEHAGSYIINLDDLAATGDYSIAHYVAADFIIDKALLSILAPSASRAYGDANPNLGWADASISGLKNGENGSVLDTLIFSIAPSATAGAHAGSTHAITIGSFADNDYALDSSAAGQLSIGKRNVTAAWNGTLSKVYGDANPVVSSAANFVYTGLANGDAASVISAIADFGTTGVNSNVGSYSVGSAFNAADYNVINAPATTLAITPRALSMSTQNQSKTYGDAEPVFAGNPIGLTAYDAALIAWSITPAAYAGHAGNYVISASATDPAGRLTNYMRSNNYGTYVVNKRGITAVVQNQKRIYGSSNAALDWQNVVWGNMASGDTGTNLDSMAISYATDATSSAHAGTLHAITLSNFVDNDYQLMSNTGGTLTITRAPLIVQANNVTRISTGPSPFFTASYDGFRNGDNANVVSGLSFLVPDTALGVGMYSITPYGGYAQDYALQYRAGTLFVSNGELPPTVEQGRMSTRISQLEIAPNTEVFTSTAFYNPTGNVDRYMADSQLPALQPAAGRDYETTKPEHTSRFLNNRYYVSFTPALQKLLGYVPTDEATR